MSSSSDLPGRGAARSSLACCPAAHSLCCRSWPSARIDAVGGGAGPGVAARDLAVRAVSFQQGEQVRGKEVARYLGRCLPYGCWKLCVAAESEQPAGTAVAGYRPERLVPRGPQRLPVADVVIGWRAGQDGCAAE